MPLDCRYNIKTMEATTENYQLKWHSFGTHLHGCVAASLHGDHFTDVALLTMDGRQILAHRFILSACSQYLHQVLKLQNKVSSATPLIIILPPEITYKTLKVLVQYMYSGETTVSQDILESVLRGGDLLKVKGLWRPREEECQDKRVNVKLHQKVGSANNSNSSTPVPQPLPEQSVIKEPKKVRPKEKSKEEVAKPEAPKAESVIKATSEEVRKEDKDKDMMQILVIKEEPLEWSEVNQEDIELVDQDDLFEAEMMIKPEIHMDDGEGSSEELYTPLTCELCSETFTLPADWVKHVQTHTDMMPAKRQKRGRPSTEEDNGNFPPLQCDMCQEFFPNPAKWVQHIQHAHTEQELHATNASSGGGAGGGGNGSSKSATYRPVRSSTNRYSSPSHKICSVCDKKFPSHASMLIHRRTHTGERPYMCDYCCKGFNVKSNLLRHLRTLHDKYVNPTDVESKEDDATSPAPAGPDVLNN